MKVTTEIRVYEINEVDTGTEEVSILIESHWNLTDRVILRIGNTNYTVIAEDLIMAIKNAQNHKKY